ncbi:S8 family serine peptidase [Parasphingopyxis marina]|uniref:S8 family serine peptidase n=1 Tax=Parasphingopyxis marina TaxID=2761622 RepID=A0A842HUF8_9SPHN|nr:S8 family serine peptidase [Parasphingopyxis marina]MBC2776021.1 S8 family serine peptidase [Parasphingopyxis marina]
MADIPFETNGDGREAKRSEDDRSEEFDLGRLSQQWLGTPEYSAPDISVPRLSGPDDSAPDLTLPDLRYTDLPGPHSAGPGLAALSPGGGGVEGGPAPFMQSLMVSKASILDGSLRALSAFGTGLQSYTASTAQAALQTLFPSLAFTGDMVVVDIAAEDPAAALAALEALGLQKGSMFGNIVSGLLPVASISALEAIDGLRFAQASQMVTRGGSTTNQADSALTADDVRGDFALDGTGIGIGVLSDSFNDLGGYATDIGTGDLPAGIIVLDDSTVGETDEGRAMLQIVHDIAPGADLYFHTAFTGIAAFAQGIIDLANAGATVIVDDVGYLNSPMFQDGIISQAVDTVTAGGAFYFSAAGNSADDSYESAFTASGVTEVNFGGELHDFDPTAGVDTSLTFELGAGESIQLSFQWDQPFFSVSGGAGSQSDVDIVIYEAGTTNIIGGSFDNNLGGDAVEIFTFTNTTGATAQFDLGIVLFSGAAPGLMKFVDFVGDANWLEYDVDASTVFGHPNADGAFAVGASAYFFTPEFGQNPPLANSYTSLGGTPILFDIFGNRLATAIDRMNVDFVAVDGGNTTFFGSDVEPDGFPNFFGTSAAAPAAAAVVALLLQAAPNATWAQIDSVLKSTAIDMEAAGTDALTGAGLIQAAAALLALLDITDNDLRGTAGADDLFALSGNDTLDGLGGNDTLDGGAGDDFIRGGNGADSIIGGADNDSVIGGSGADNISGDDGNDTLRGGRDDDSVNGGNGNDRLSGEAGNDTLAGGDGNDTLAGSSGNDSMVGGAGDDTYFLQQAGDEIIEAAGEGWDRVFVYLDGITAPDNVEELRLVGPVAREGFGNALDNILAGGGGSDTLHGGDGNDTLAGNGGGDELHGDNGDDRLLGSDGADTLFGGADNDRLQGEADNDILNGDAGADTLFGGAGRDTLTGGGGADRFAFVDGDLSATLSQTDRITDFSQAESDRIQLVGIDADTTVGGTQDFTFIGTDAFSGAAGELRYQQIGGETRIFGDTDGDMVADFAIRIEDTVTLVVGDFIL